MTSQCSHNVLPQSFTSPSKKIAQKFTSFCKPVTRGQTIRRSCSANLDEVSDEFSSEYIKELAKSFELSCESVIDEQHSKTKSMCTLSHPNISISEHRRNKYDETDTSLRLEIDYLEPLISGIRPEPADWPEREEVLRASIERKANRMEIPMSLRIIKKKQQRHEGFRDVRHLDSCSFQKAFSSMEFIIIELQTRALQMREVLCDEDLVGIIAKVQCDMHMSFMWLFKQVFSQTPALMIDVMILLANFGLYSTAHNIGSESVIMGPIHEGKTEDVSTEQHKLQYIQSYSSEKFDSCAGSSVADGNRQLSRSARSFDCPSAVPDHKYPQELNSVEEMKLWNSMVDEAKEMQIASLGDTLDHEELQWFVSPVTVEIEPDNYMDYFRTDLLYQMGLSQNPDNSLLLCNYAQFLQLVTRDYDRAEECFKRATEVEPPDAESMSHYANFLWKVRKDLWGAEERYIQAMAAEPENPYHASKYANFLWNTGGEETCFPLDTTQNNSKAL